MLDFVETMASETGLPVGIKSAVGESAFWEDLVRLMADGTAASTSSRRWRRRRHGCRAARVCRPRGASVQAGDQSCSEDFAEHGLHQRIVFIGSGKLGFPEAALFAFALGCDMINVAREAMMSIGCIQAQRCHTGHCPTGVATNTRGSCGESTQRSNLRGSPTTSSRCGRTCFRSVGRAVSHTRHSSPRISWSYSTIGSAQRPSPNSSGYGRGFGAPVAY